MSFLGKVVGVIAGMAGLMFIINLVTLLGEWISTLF